MFRGLDTQRKTGIILPVKTKPMISRVGRYKTKITEIFWRLKLEIFGD